MIKYLAAAAREARQAADPKVKIIHVAVVADVDTSTVSRFEKGVAWPQDPEALIAGYASVLELDPIELWLRAISLWIESGTPDLEAAARMVQVVGNAADQTSGGRSRARPRARDSKPAAD